MEVTLSETEDEDPAEYFERTVVMAKLKELERLAEFGVYEIVDMHTSLGKKRVTTHFGSGPQEGRNQGTVRCERVQG